MRKRIDKAHFLIKNAGKQRDEVYFEVRFEGIRHLASQHGGIRLVGIRDRKCLLFVRWLRNLSSHRAAYPLRGYLAIFAAVDATGDSDHTSGAETPVPQNPSSSR